jgi:hypothetical protein
MRLSLLLSRFSIYYQIIKTLIAWKFASDTMRNLVGKVESRAISGGLYGK